jgi:hypothetical protein
VREARGGGGGGGGRATVLAPKNSLMESLATYRSKSSSQLFERPPHLQSCQSRRCRNCSRHTNPAKGFFSAALPSVPSALRLPRRTLRSRDPSAPSHLPLSACDNSNGQSLRSSGDLRAMRSRRRMRLKLLQLTPPRTLPSQQQRRPSRRT